MSVKHMNSASDVATGNANIGKHVVIEPVEHLDRGEAALPLTDRLDDVFHSSGSLF